MSHLLTGPLLYARLLWLTLRINPYVLSRDIFNAQINKFIYFYRSKFRVFEHSFLKVSTDLVVIDTIRMGTEYRSSHSNAPKDLKSSLAQLFSKL